MKEQDIENLLKAAGPLPQADPKMMNDIKSATEQAWMDVVSSRKQRIRRTRLNGLFATAAALLVAVGLHFSLGSDPSSLESEKIATIMKQNGNVTLNGKRYAKNQIVQAGDTISTAGKALLTLELKDKTTITFAGDTEITLANHNTLNLDKGRIYISSTDINTQVTIVTPWGNIKDIGTQYEVDMSDSTLKVSMRTGKVAMVLDNGLIYAETSKGYGDVVTVDSQNKVTKQTVAATDARWNWTRDAIADIDIEGLNVHDLIEWTHQITGKNINYANAKTERVAMGTRLSGGRISPKHVEKTLPRILETTHLVAEITETEIMVDLAPSD